MQDAWFNTLPLIISIARDQLEENDSLLFLPIIASVSIFFLIPLLRGIENRSKLLCMPPFDW